MEALRDAFVDELIKLSESNRTVVLDCDVGRHTKLNKFKDKYENRFYQIGIAEQNAVSIAAGMAKGGRIPIVSSFAMFICGRTWEQIRHSVSYNEANVKIFATHSGLSAGEDGGSHQCIEDIALMMSLPNIEVFAPAFPYECRKICSYVIQSKKPAYIRVGRNPVDFDINESFSIGDPILLGNENADVAVISMGEITQEVIKAYEYLKEFKIIHIGSLRPINKEKLSIALKNVKKAIVIEEHTKFGGLLGVLKTYGILQDIEIVPMNMGNNFGQTGSIEELRLFYGLSNNDIIKNIRLLDGSNNV